MRALRRWCGRADRWLPRGHRRADRCRDQIGDVARGSALPSVESVWGYLTAMATRTEELPLKAISIRAFALPLEGAVHRKSILEVVKHLAPHLANPSTIRY